MLHRIDCYHGKGCEHLLLKHFFPSFVSSHHAEWTLSTDSQLLLGFALEVICIFLILMPSLGQLSLNLHRAEFQLPHFPSEEDNVLHPFAIIKRWLWRGHLALHLSFPYIMTWKMNPDRKLDLPNHEMSPAKPPSLMDSLMISQSSCIFLEGRRAVCLAGISSKYSKWGMSFFTSAL